jgi:hypothetical protein
VEVVTALEYALLAVLVPIVLVIAIRTIGYQQGQLPWRPLCGTLIRGGMRRP